MSEPSAAAYTARLVEQVEDDPSARVQFLRQLYEVPSGFDRGHLPYRRAASAFMGWQCRRGLLNPATDRHPGSPWWRAVNSALLRDTCEARALALGRTGEPSGPGVRATLEFIRRPNAAAWYRAHNISIVGAFLANEQLARREGRVERFFVNLVLVRVLYAHSLVAAPRLALNWLAPLGRLLGDPRLGMTGLFLSLARVLPARYPLGDDVGPYLASEHGVGRLLDRGVIEPRIHQLYDWSAAELGVPALRGLLVGTTPAYAWDAADDGVWHPAPSPVIRVVRRAVPPLGADTEHG